MVKELDLEAGLALLLLQEASTLALLMASTLSFLRTLGLELVDPADSFLGWCLGEVGGETLKGGY